MSSVPITAPLTPVRVIAALVLVLFVGPHQYACKSRSFDTPSADDSKSSSKSQEVGGSQQEEETECPYNVELIMSEIGVRDSVPLSVKDGEAYFSQGRERLASMDLPPWLLENLLPHFRDSTLNPPNQLLRFEDISGYFGFLADRAGEVSGVVVHSSSSTAWLLLPNLFASYRTLGPGLHLERNCLGGSVGADHWSLGWQSAEFFVSPRPSEAQLQQIAAEMAKRETSTSFEPGQEDADDFLVTLVEKQATALRSALEKANLEVRDYTNHPSRAAFYESYLRYRRK